MINVDDYGASAQALAATTLRNVLDQSYTDNTGLLLAAKDHVT